MLGRYPTDSFAILLVLRIIFLLLDPTPVQAQAFPSVYPSTSPSTSQPPSIDCSNVRAEINILTDQSPQETNWVLSKITTTNDITILEGNPQQKGSYYADEICLGDGEYNFTIYDSYGDGIGGDGHYSISLDGKVIAKGGNFGTSETVAFPIPYDKFPSQSPSMSLTPSLSPSMSLVPSTSVSPSFTSLPSISTSPSMSSLPSEAPSSLPTVCVIYYDMIV